MSQLPGSCNTDAVRADRMSISTITALKPTAANAPDELPSHARRNFRLGVISGAAALPFLNKVAGTVPPQRRGMYFGWRRFLGGALGLLRSGPVKLVLSPDSGLAFPGNYALLFRLGLVITTVLVGSFSLIVEPAEIVNISTFADVLSHTDERSENESLGAGRCRGGLPTCNP